MKRTPFGAGAARALLTAISSVTFTLTTHAAAYAESHYYSGTTTSFFNYSPPTDYVGEPGELIRFQKWKNEWGKVTPNLYRVLYWSTYRVVDNQADPNDPNCGSYELTLPARNGLAEETVWETRCDKPIVTSGLVNIPSLPAPEEGYPTFAFTHGTLGVIPKCGPSRFIGPKWIDQMVNENAKTVAADYPGLGYDSGLRSSEANYTSRHPWYRWLKQRPYDQTSHTYGDAWSTGTTTVDIVRASQQVEAELAGIKKPRNNIGTNNKFAVMGSSQGGQGALATGMVMGNNYAPELNLVAVMAGAPAGNFDNISTINDNLRRWGQGLLTAAIVAASITDDEIKPSEYLTNIAEANYNRTSEMICSGTEDYEAYLWWVNIFYSYPFKYELEDLVRLPEFRKYATRATVNKDIKAPILLGQAKGDPLVQPANTKVLRRQLIASDPNREVILCEFPSNGSEASEELSLKAMENHTTIKTQMFTGSRNCRRSDGRKIRGSYGVGKFLSENGFTGFETSK